MTKALHAFWTGKTKKRAALPVWIALLVFSLFFDAPALAQTDKNGDPAAPQIQVNTQEYFFGTVNAGSHSSPVSFTIQNTGTADLEVTSIVLAGENTGEFSIAPGSCPDLAPTLAPDESCAVEVTYSPVFEPANNLWAGPKSAELFVYSNDPVLPALEIQLLGDATNIQAGDVNYDGVVGLQDAVLCLQAAAGIKPAAHLYLAGAMGEAGRLGLTEALYALQVEAHVEEEIRDPEKHLQIWAPAFPWGGRIPEKYTVDGENISFRIFGRNAPDPATKSFVLILDDPDAPGGLWTHWIVYSFLADERGIPENMGAPGGVNLPAGARHGVNSNGNAYYNGPGPPIGDGPHRYYFTVYALNVDTPPMPANPDRATLDAAMEGHILQKAHWMGTYQRD